ncbi:prepilin peptidase [Shinella sp. CPCC 101442]|uniref:A24 family peptidase n=1 Tax=Shinella sp. CPCC 101442 TaxID=2932265 RepID=UPI0021535BA3|nr:prepilin peptidase [Shinella sp. CPCC 101442]MCR6500554.1 prepilin peptidase [Shinella sp. CPCC 101442]
MTQALIFVIFPFCLAVAAFSDFFTMTIPNRVSVILLGAFLVAAPLAGLGLTEIAMHLGAGLLMFSIGFVLFALNTMGGGDVKLLSASAVWFGINPSLMEYMIYVSAFGGLLTLGILILRAKTSMVHASGLPVPVHLLSGRKVPYGIAIGAAAFVAYPSSPLMLAALG